MTKKEMIVKMTGLTQENLIEHACQKNTRNEIIDLYKIYEYYNGRIGFDSISMYNYIFHRKSRCFWKSLSEKSILYILTVYGGIR